MPRWENGVLTIFILQLNNLQIFKPITPKWGDAAARSGSTVLRTRYLCKTPDDHDLGSIPGFRLIFARVFYNLLRDDSPWKQFQISTPISLRFRVKLICIFSADHENVVYRKLIYQKPSQPPQQSGGRLRRYRWSYSVLDVFVRLSSSWASAYDFLLFFRWECAAFFGQTGGREYSNSINAVKGSVDKSPKGA